MHKHNENQEQEQQQVDEAAPVPAGEAAAQERRGAVSGDDVSQLTELKGLLDSGVLTQAEFDAEKHKILGI